MNLLIALKNYGDADALQDVRQFAALAKKHGHCLTLLTLEKELPPGFHHSAKLLSCRRTSILLGKQYSFQRGFDQAMASGNFNGSIAFSPVEGADFYVPRNFFNQANQRKRNARIRELCHGQPWAFFAFVTKSQGISLLKDGGVPRARTFQIDPEFHPQFLPLHDQDGASREQLRKELFIKDKHILVLQCADDWHRQGVDNSLAALALLPAGIRSVCHYALISSHGSQSKLEAWAEAHGFSAEHVLFLGQRWSLLEMRTAADLMLHPAREEEAGVMLMDALTAGLPVVCTDICGYSVFLHRTCCPVIPKPFHIKAISDALSFTILHLKTIKKILPGEFARLGLRNRAEQLLNALENQPILRPKMLELPELEAIIHAHERNLQEHQALKDERKRAVSRVLHNGVLYLVKEFKKREWWHWNSCVSRTERGTLLLTRYTPSVCGKFRSRRNGSEYLVFRACGEGNFFQREYAERKDADTLYQACGQLLAELHDAGIYHQDAKPANFVLNQFCQDECPLPVCLVDCDNVLQMPTILNVQERIHNLAQFIAGTGKLARHDLAHWRECITAFCNGYNANAMLPTGDLDQLWQRVWRAIKAKHHLEYTLPEEITLDESTQLN